MKNINKLHFFLILFLVFVFLALVIFGVFFLKKIRSDDSYITDTTQEVFVHPEEIKESMAAILGPFPLKDVSYLNSYLTYSQEDEDKYLSLDSGTAFICINRYINYGTEKVDASTIVIDYSRLENSDVYYSTQFDTEKLKKLADFFYKNKDIPIRFKLNDLGTKAYLVVFYVEDCNRFNNALLQL